MSSSPAVYHLISLNPPPKSIRAFTNRRENYKYDYNNDRTNLIEINFLQEGSIQMQHGDREITFAQGTVHTRMGCYTYSQHSTDQFLHEFFLHITLSEKPVPISEEQAASWFSTAHQAILPEYITDPAICEQIGNLIKSVIGVAFSSYVCRGLKLRAVMYECMMLLTEYAVEQAQKNRQMPQKTRSRCTIKAIEYIDKHLSEKLRVEDIATAVGDNYDHLKRIFRKEMSMTIVEYINRRRIRLVEQCITVQGMTLAQAGVAVGIHDVKYLSRMFHRCTGMTAREYKRTYSERWNSGN